MLPPQARVEGNGQEDPHPARPLQSGPAEVGYDLVTGRSTDMGEQYLNSSFTFQPNYAIGNNHQNLSVTDPTSIMRRTRGPNGW